MISKLARLDESRGKIHISKNVRVFDYSVIKGPVIIGDDTTIGPLVDINPNIVIGKGCSIWSQCHLTEGLIIEDYVFMGPMTMTTNTKRPGYKRDHTPPVEAPIIRKGAFIGASVTILPGVEIGEEAIIGAGSVVTKNVPARELWAGNPARKFRDVGPEDYLSQKFRDNS